MSKLNKRILDTINESDYDQTMKDFLKELLMIELRNFEDKYPRYTKDYEQILTRYIRREM